MLHFPVIKDDIEYRLNIRAKKSLERFTLRGAINHATSHEQCFTVLLIYCLLPLLVSVTDEFGPY